MTDSDVKRCGYATIIGLPNAGKSTLLNALVGTKISIVSRKVQTTRSRLLGIVLHQDAQIVFVDTPGVFIPKKNLERAMVSAALECMGEANTVLHLVDCTGKNPLEKNRIIIEKLPKNKPCALVLNKVDSIHKPALLKIAQDFLTQFDYGRVFMISALKNKGTEDLLAYTAGQMPEGPWLFPEDQITDIPMRMLAAELTREQVFHQLHDELPYSVFVETESWEQKENGNVHISQVIFVQKDTQKHIVIGKGGAQIKNIGQRVRQELEEMLETHVHLNLFVKVQKNWNESPENFRLIGLEYPS